MNFENWGQKLDRGRRIQGSAKTGDIHADGTIEVVRHQRDALVLDLHLMYRSPAKK